MNEDQITAFNISSPDTIDSFLPFTSLNSLFNYSSGSSSTGEEITPKKFRYYASGGPPRYDHDFKEDWTSDHHVYLMKPPEENGNYTFIVDFAFSDGRLLSDTIDVTLF